MRAIVWKEDGTLQLESEWPAPPVGDDEVLVEIRAAGVCSTDIHMIRGNLPFAKPPWVLGHEMSGVVVETGRLVHGWAAGQRVIIDPVVTCGYCEPCLSGKKYLCEAGGELGTTYGSGGYGQFVAVKPSNLYPLPDALSFAEGAMMEPLNCTMGAVERVPNMAGSRVLVFGPGPAGLLFCQLAKAYGALHVTLAGLSDPPLQLGQRLGADRIVNLAEHAAKHALSGETFDVVIEASGSVEAVRDGMACIAKGGTLVLYGLNGSPQPNLVSDQIVLNDMTVVTCISAPLLWNKGIRLVESGKVNVNALITDRIAFDDAAVYLNEMVRGQFRPVKMMILHA
jgi:threonine dehydrogenase-like Zn-dependent dehydrogenase